METPSSIRRFTRSQALAAANNSVSNSNSVPISKKIEDSEMGLSKSRKGKNQQDRSSSALVDITNGSPIVGLAVGTPSSGISKGSRVKKTPGSGEALLRGQVKTLLQKVEEEAEISKLTLGSRPFLNLKNLAPTPANTPQIPNFSDEGGINNDVGSISAPPVTEEQLMMISEVESEISERKKEGTLESQKSLITRSLLLDFSEKSESSDSWECSSVVTTAKSTQDDASVWSIQANASTQDEEEEDVIEEEEVEEEEEDDDDYYYEEEEEEEEGDCWMDELCAGMSKINVEEKGKHIRFVYNNNDEVVKVEEVLRLKGMPTPKGKHLRFPLEEEEEDN